MGAENPTKRKTTIMNDPKRSSAEKLPKTAPGPLPAANDVTDRHYISVITDRILDDATATNSLKSCRAFAAYADAFITTIAATRDHGWSDSRNKVFHDALRPLGRMLEDNLTAHINHRPLPHGVNAMGTAALTIASAYDDAGLSDWNAGIDDRLL